MNIHSPKVVAALIAVALCGSIFWAVLLGGAVNHLKETAFQKRQAKYEQAIKDSEAKASSAAAEADQLKQQSAAKDSQIASLENEKSQLQVEAEQKRVVYVNARKPPALRAPGVGVSDAELRADAQRLGIVIR